MIDNPAAPPRFRPDSRPVYLAFVAFCVLLPLVGCLRRQAEPPPVPLVAEEALTEGEAPVRRIPAKPLEWMKTPPCDDEMGEVVVNGACYVELAKRPPCGRLPEHAGKCFRAIAKAPREPTSIRR
jgi:hypothetical protein